jgi:hypothetical protein
VHLFGAAVDPNDRAPGVNQPFRQRAVAASQIQNALAWLGRQEFEHFGSEVRHETSISRVQFRVPALTRHAFFSCPVNTGGSRLWPLGAITLAPEHVRGFIHPVFEIPKTLLHTQEAFVL